MGNTITRRTVVKRGLMAGTAISALGLIGSRASGAADREMPAEGAFSFPAKACPRQAGARSGARYFDYRQVSARATIK
jgi:hypothetical protein